jgi:hypothetical protein
MRARVEAKQAYLNTYNMAVKAENAAESQERKDRAAREKHELQRHKLYGALKGRADKKEGWIKLQREMVLSIPPPHPIPGQVVGGSLCLVHVVTGPPVLMLTGCMPQRRG